MIKLGTNLLSQTVQRNLGRATQDLSKASERLSSGQRINRASDDAAGLAISMSLDKDRLLARTAQRNVSDGISMVSIMSAGLKSQKEILFRMAELAEQSANGTYSAKQREVLQKEYSSLMDEFDRVADASEFNGVKLLRNATPQTIQFMAGITGADTSLLQVTAANSHRYAGMVTQKSDLSESGNSDVTDLSILTANLKPANMSNATPTDAVSLSKSDFQDVAVLSYTDSLGRKGTSSIIITRLLNDFGTLTKFGSGPNTTNDVALRQDILAIATSETGEETFLIPQIASGGVMPSSYTLNFTFATSGATAAITLDLTGTTFESVDTGRSTQRPSAIGFTNILHNYSAKRAVTTITNRIDDLSALEGQYGAVESRLNVAHNLLATSGENFAAAGSRIKDADIASEAATSVRSGILQQAATSLLAQANQAPQIAISLLGGI